MAYPNAVPRRRQQAVPTLPQMIKRRAGSPGGVLRNNRPGLQGTIPAKKGGGRRNPPQATGGRPNPGGVKQMPGGPMTDQFPHPSLGGMQPGGGGNLGNGQYPITTDQGMTLLGGGNAGGGPVGPGGAQNGQPGVGTGGGNTGGGVPAGGGNTDPMTGLPLDAYFEAQRRMLEDTLSSQMGTLNPQRELLAAQLGQNTARLNTNQGVDQRHLNESLAGRGAFGGGIQNRDTGYLNTDYMRQLQDLTNSNLGANANLGLQQSQYQQQYSQGLQQALMDLANRMSTSQYAVTPTPGVTAPGTGGGGGGQGGGGNAGGGKKWTPSWQPTWQPPHGGRRR